MAITRWDPFTEFGAMRGLIDRVMEESYRRSPMWSSNGGDSKIVRPLPLDVYDASDVLVVRTFVPGATPDQVNVTFEQGTLTIQAHIPSPTEGEGAEGYHWMQRELGYGDFGRSVTLPGAWDVAKAEAHFENGLLTLTVPKAEAAKPRKIDVRVGS